MHDPVLAGWCMVVTTKSMVVTTKSMVVTTQKLGCYHFKSMVGNFYMGTNSIVINGFDKSRYAPICLATYFYV